MKRVLQNKIVANFLKFGIAAAIIGWLVYDASTKKEFTELLRQPKDWGLIGLAFGLFFVGVILTFVRWQLLVRALGFPFTVKDSFRLGFLGYLFNFVAPGGVGGDLFKAVFIAREFHGRRAQAVATVFIDRVVGLYALFVVAAAAVLIDGLYASPSEAVQTAAWLTIAGAVIGAIFILMMLVPGFTSGRVSTFLGNLPRTGRIFRQLIDAVRMYRERLGIVATALAISVVVHMLSVGGFYLLGQSFAGMNPTLGEHFVIVPLAMVAGALPITPNGLGTFEAAIEALFPMMSQAEGTRGLLVSLIFRFITIAIALVGVLMYFVFRREVAEALHDVEEPPPEDDVAAPVETT